MKFSDKNLPNILTCLNLLCGCLAIVSVFSGNIPLLAGMVFLAAMFDLLDGLSARSLNAHSDLGKQLDSLADMVTFGVVPGLILYDIMAKGQATEIISSGFLLTILRYFPFIITVFAAFRLAKFNIDKRQTNFFLGLPTPAMGIFVTSLPLIMRYDKWNLTPFISHPAFIILITCALSLMMIAEVPLFALKFKNTKWIDNKVQFIFIILSVLLFSFLLFTAIPIIIFLYIILSLINHSSFKRITL